MNPVTSVVAPAAPQSGHTRSESRRKRVRKTSNPASHETHARSYVGMWTLSLAVIPANTIASEREPHERGRREDPAHPHPARLSVSPESAPMPVTMLDEVNAGVAHAPLSAANHNLLRRADAAGQRLFRELLTAHIPWAIATEVRRLIAVDVVAVSVLAAGCHHPQPCAIDHCLDSLEMKAVLGNRSPRLPGLILSSGAGVGGHALRSGRTMYTPEYASSAVDQDLVSVAADDEGIVSLLAVPISFAGVVRAMLHVGWRHSSPVDHGVAEALSRVATYAGAAFAVASDRVRVEEAARMRERRRLVRALHDDLGQHMFTLGIQTRRSRESASRGDPELLSHLYDLESQVVRTSAALRRTMTDLVPVQPSEGSLEAALHDDVTGFERRTGTTAHLLVLNDLATVEPAVASLLTRVASEGLRNVERHAQASEVVVSLRSTDEAAELTVQDDGVGVHGRLDEGHLGLERLTQDVVLRGGEIRLTSNDDGGSTLRVWLPSR